MDNAVHESQEAVRDELAAAAIPETAAAGDRLTEPWPDGPSSPRAQDEDEVEIAPLRRRTAPIPATSSELLTACGGSWDHVPATPRRHAFAPLTLWRLLTVGVLAAVVVALLVLTAGGSEPQRSATSGVVAPRELWQDATRSASRAVEELEHARAHRLRVARERQARLERRRERAHQRALARRRAKAHARRRAASRVHATPSAPARAPVQSAAAPPQPAAAPAAPAPRASGEWRKPSDVCQDFFC